MNPIVNIETAEIKASVKRNGIAKVVVSLLVIGVIYYLVTSSIVTLLTGLYILIGYMLVMDFLFYWIIYSLFIDTSIYGMKKRAHAL